jgi:adenine-specific DNA-methyltransferase
MFKRMGKEVTYNDEMRWNYLVGTALVENDHVRLSETEIESLIRPVICSERGFVSKTFRGMYFTERENLWIDTLITRIGEITAPSKNREAKLALAYYGLFQTCLAKRPFNLFHRAIL